MKEELLKIINLINNFKIDYDQLFKKPYLSRNLFLCEDFFSFDICCDAEISNLIYKINKTHFYYEINGEYKFQISVYPSEYLLINVENKFENSKYFENIKYVINYFDMDRSKIEINWEDIRNKHLLNDLKNYFNLDFE